MEYKQRDACEMCAIAFLYFVSMLRMCVFFFLLSLAQVQCVFGMYTPNGICTDNSHPPCRRLFKITCTKCTQTKRTHTRFWEASTRAHKHGLQIGITRKCTYTNTTTTNFTHRTECTYVVLYRCCSAFRSFIHGSKEKRKNTEVCFHI